MSSLVGCKTASPLAGRGEGTEAPPRDPSRALLPPAGSTAEGRLRDRTRAAPSSKRDTSPRCSTDRGSCVSACVDEANAKRHAQPVADFARRVWAAHPWVAAAFISGASESSPARPPCRYALRGTARTNRRLTFRNGSCARSQFSSTALPRISSAPGRMAGSASLQSVLAVKPSPSRSISLARSARTAATPLCAAALPAPSVAVR